ncbi:MULTISPECIES: hybrid sensor histidine kinase/response regulator [Nostocales]|uniref:histidine kinase n=3 Tax=Nostocales TaxID=1161 RepID=A0A0C1N3X0_9CYAN|nr:response regulator [Tolypothrix bouteillei]KAF3889417.1 response regulator [Tolypothrix bouteillei VB521301]
MLPQSPSLASKVDILIVDDEPTNLRVLSTIVRSYGYQVRQAISGMVALRAVGIQRPDLILLDIMMPEMDGYQVCEQLKLNAETSDIPVIFLSSLVSGMDKAKAFQLGGADYITKPFQVEEVLARIDYQLTLRTLQVQLQQKNEQLREQNDQLRQEIKIREQTEVELRCSQAQLQARTQQLQQALDELKLAQTKLVQSEKMSSLGQIAAGIAHEINNPISFIYGNLDYASEYTEVLINIIKLYSKYYPQPHPEILKTIQVCELDFVLKDFPKVLESMQVGAERIRDIVLSMRYFSGYDQAYTQQGDLHKCLDSTLVILQSRLKEQPNRVAIEVKKEYGKIPPANCYPGQLNQVFMNLFSNAIDAIEEKSRIWEEPFQPAIKICTQLSNSYQESQDRDKKWVEIRIADNGIGIAPHIQSSIFDPFFTTKPVGKGTGLGLSISYSIIVEQHGGQLQCNSQIGQGTEIVIRLPVEVPQAVKSGYH